MSSRYSSRFLFFFWQRDVMIDPILHYGMELHVSAEAPLHPNPVPVQDFDKPKPDSSLEVKVLPQRAFR